MNEIQVTNIDIMKMTW